MVTQEDPELQASLAHIKRLWPKEQFPLGEKKRLSNSSTLNEQENLHGSKWERLRHNLTINPTPAQQHTIGSKSQPQACP